MKRRWGDNSRGSANTISVSLLISNQLGRRRKGKRKIRLERRDIENEWMRKCNGYIMGYIGNYYLWPIDSVWFVPQKVGGRVCGYMYARATLCIHLLTQGRTVQKGRSNPSNPPANRTLPIEVQFLKLALIETSKGIKRYQRLHFLSLGMWGQSPSHLHTDSVRSVL